MMRWIGVVMLVGCGGAAVGPTSRPPLHEGVATADGAAVVYAERGGIWRQDAASGRARLIYTTPQRPDPVCPSSPAPPGTPGTPALKDEVVGLADGGATLVVHRSVPRCELERRGSYEVRITDFEEPATLREHPAHPIYAVAAVDEVLYLLDGAGLGRSRDRGASFAAVPAPWDGVPVALLAVAGARPALVVLVSDNGSSRTVDGAFTDIIGGALLRSDDDGATWRRLPLPEALRNPCREPHEGACGDGRGVTWVAAPSGAPARLVIGGELDGAAWTSVDGGATWVGGAGHPPPRLRTARIGDDTFEATADGLVRIHGGARRTMTPLLTEPLRADRF
jgi:hypothetical protein